MIEIASMIEVCAEEGVSPEQLFFILLFLCCCLYQQATQEKKNLKRVCWGLMEKNSLWKF